MSIPIGKACNVVFCNELVIAQGLCAKHYKQMQRHGAPSKDVSAKTIDGKKLLDHPLYATWRSICRVARGTRVCLEWQDFEQFVKDVGIKPLGAKSLRRIDTSKAYSKDNARWHVSDTPDNTKLAARERMHDFYAANPEYARWSSIKSKYGLTQAEYLELEAAQNGVCAICKKPEKRTTKSGERMNLHVDHCHNSKQVRGLLCHSCNTALGLLGDDVELFRTAIKYLVSKKL